MKDDTLLWVVVIAVVFWFLTKEPALTPSPQPQTNGNAPQGGVDVGGIIRASGDLVSDFIDLFRRSGGSADDSEHGAVSPDRN